MEFISQILPASWIYALGWTVVHSLWQGILLAALLYLVLQVNKNRSSVFRYRLSCGTLLIFSILSLLTFAYYFQNFTETTLTQSILSSPPVIDFAPSNANSIMEEKSFYSTWTDQLNIYLPIIVSLWAVGFLFFSLKMGMGWLYLEKLKKKGVQTISVRWQDRFKKLAAAFPIQKTVQLAESAFTKVPILAGYLKPIILLPIGTINLLTVEEVEAILAHELAHIARNDFIANIALSCIETLFYYHPAIWLISNHIRLERENCCDDLALQHTQNPMAYAKALLKLEQAQHLDKAPTLAMSFTAAKPQLLYRIQRILKQPQTKSNNMEKCIAMLSLLGVMALLSFSYNSDNSDSANFKEKENLSPTASDVCEISPSSDALANFTSLDTSITESHYTHTIRTEVDGQDIEFAQANDELTKLVINGRVIPPSAYAQHTKLIGKLQRMGTQLPIPHTTPPTPPAVNTKTIASPLTPPIPPAPPRLVSLKHDSIPSTEKQELIKDFNDIKINKPLHLYLDDENKTILLSFVNEDREVQELLLDSESMELEGFLKMSLDPNNIRPSDLKSISISVDTLINPEQRELLEEIRKERLELMKERKKLEAQLALLKENEKEVMATVNKDPKNHNLKDLYEKSDFNKVLVKELMKDQLIDDPENYKIKMSGKRMKVNGKNVSSLLHQEYLNLYKEINHSSLSNHDKIEIAVSSN